LWSQRKSCCGNLVLLFWGESVERLYEFIIGLEVIVGEEHIVDETSVDAKNKEEALRVAEDLARDFYPTADSINLKVKSVRPLSNVEMREIS